MSDVAANQNGAPANGGADGGSSSATISVPKYFTDNLGKEVTEEVTKLAGKDPEFAKGIPQTLPEFGKAWLSSRSQLAEITRKYKEAEEGRKPPNSPQDYAFDKPDLPKGMVYDQQLEQAFRTWAHEEGLSAAAAKNIFAKFNAGQLQRFKAQSEQAEKQAVEAEASRKVAIDNLKTTLRTQMGESYDARMPRNLAALQNPVMIPKDVADAFDKSGLLRNPSFHLWWDRQVAMMSSDRKLGLNREEGDGLEADQDKGKLTETDGQGKAHLKAGFFKKTAERHPARKKAG